jgi:hypothetical protein
MSRDVLFLLALPASGKSEIRRYLDALDPEEASSLGLGRPVHLDDYPYVHAMRVADEAARAAGRPSVFFDGADEPFADSREWTVLTRLLAEDVDVVLGGGRPPKPTASGLLDRIGHIHSAVGLPIVDARLRSIVEAPLEPEARRIASAVHEALEQWDPDAATLVVEFARGGPAGAPLPLEPPFGYRHALAQFRPEILGRSRVLYVWVEPQDSRRRNRERAVTGMEGSTLHHGVPETVMLQEYGCDDIDWMLDHAGSPGTIDIAVDDRVLSVPAARLDNRDDLTSHLRADPAVWDEALRAELHRRLVTALGR